MSDPEKYIEEANKLENSSSVFEFLMKNMTYDRYEKISKLYEKAGNIYKLSDKSKAIKCFQKAYNYLIQINHIYSHDYELKKFITDIAELYSKINYTKSIEYYEKLINIYSEKGDVPGVAKTYETIGLIYFDNNLIEESKKVLLKTLELVRMNDKVSDVKRRVGEKLSELIIMNEVSQLDILEASKIYFELAEDCLKSKFGQYTAKKYIFLGLLSDLAGGDNVKTNNDLEKFSSLDYTFGSSREGQFIFKLINLIDSNDSEGISDLSADFNQITPLDNIQVKLLLNIKESIGSFVNTNGYLNEEIEVDLC